MLRRAINTLRQRLRLARFQRHATVAPTAIIGPQAQVINPSGNCKLIVVGGNSCVKGELLVYGHGGSIRVGEHCYIGECTRIWSAVGIEIGNRVLISHGVQIHDSSGHSRDATERHEHFVAIMSSGHPKISPPGLRSAPVVIEDDAWISFNVTILSGVRIGRGAIVGAGSVVTQDVPAMCVFRNTISPIVTPIAV